eukprot:TRINITY_DN3471_c0_g1_i1.p1 TRINITY_DN3471_c0_g1~~TRINITY_DN3471_c0_g1_i1.p1  ORF type:complete len:322 (+),score=52.93 TRINITY_DN3471_c0_g1_i1:269-1234(+)
MHLSNTGKAGRGEQSGDIIGTVILHGKKHLWGKSRVHYHHGMKAGENTLNALCARVVTRSIISTNGKYNSSDFLDKYVKFMTTPNTHNDTFAEGYHRDFFSNYARGVPPEKCAGDEGHDTPSVGGLVTLPPVIFAAYFANKGKADARAKIQETTIQHLYLTHKSSNLAKYASVYAELLIDLLEADEKSNAKDIIKSYAKKVGVDVQRLLNSGMSDEDVVSRQGMACYITSSFPNVLYLAYKYSNDFEKGVLANTNAGGENCHRGSALGTILGLVNGYDKLPASLVNGLVENSNIREEIEQVIPLWTQTEQHSFTQQSQLVL